MNLLVSAIMPTRGRPDLAREAKRMFDEQTYPNKELVIVDDLMEPSFPYGVVPGAVYSKAPRVSIGEKRNLCVAKANGQIIIHWDDDDRYSPDRMAHQVEMLTTGVAAIVGYHEMEFEREDGARFLYRGSPGKPCGTSFCYWKRTWEVCKFEHIDNGEDGAFLRTIRQEKGLYSAQTTQAQGRIVARIHNGNTASKLVEGNPIQWKRVA